MNERLVTGIVLDEEVEMTLDEFCLACSQSTAWVVELVEEGILEPVEWEAERWRFSGVSLVRAQAARRLQRDLDVNLPGVALALDLLDEISELRERLDRLSAGEGDV
jgi:chaperone modulatory protein CbpM